MAVVAALYVASKGVYTQDPRVDAYDIVRDARTYVGHLPVVCHPPCQLWTNLAAVNWKRYRRTLPAWYPGGSDGGHFAFCLEQLARVGGVIEHPAKSWAWSVYGLPKPKQAAGVWTFCRGWFVTRVYQSAYGHKARKETWLLYQGIQPKCLRGDVGVPTHQISGFDKRRPTVTKREAIATPIAFKEELMQLAMNSRGDM